MKMKLYHWDYDKNVSVDDGEVSISQIARCISSDEMTELLDDFLNYGGKQFPEGKEIGSKLRRAHRTLQRSVICFAIGLLVGISEQEHSDPRNATALETAKFIAKLHNQGSLPLGPYL